MGGRLIVVEIHCPVVAYQDTVSRHAHMGAEFFSPPPYATPAQRAVTDNNISSTPYLVIYGGVGLAVQLVRIHKLSA